MKGEKCLLLKIKNAASYTSVQENSILLLFMDSYPHI